MHDPLTATVISALRSAVFSHDLRPAFRLLLLLAILLVDPAASSATAAGLEVGLARRDITPEGSIWLNGYAARTHASEGVAQKLTASAVAFFSGEDRFVTIALDNCEVNAAFNRPVLAEIEARTGLAPEQVIVVSSHTHSGPCLAGVLGTMFRFSEEDQARVEAYTARLGETLIQLVLEALADRRPARLDLGRGWAGFAMNRRVFKEGRVDFGENPDGPVDRDVPVLRITEPTADRAAGDIRAIIFGYACHGTTIAGDDFYQISGDYMAFAREHIEAAFPGARALYLTGFGADANPAPRGTLALSRRHGLELAGAVTGVLGRPLKPVAGEFRRASTRVSLALAPSPDRKRLEEDAAVSNPFIAARARLWLSLLAAGQPLPTAVELPLTVVRFGDDLTFFFMGGEVVVDYARRLQAELGEAHPWPIGYAHEVPCYIPSLRILKEGGYESDSSLIYYGIYGPFTDAVEESVMAGFHELWEKVKGAPGPASR